MMRNLFVSLAVLAVGLICAVKANETLVAPDHIKVSLFAAPAFYSEVGVDVRNATCLSLYNNL